MILDVSVRKKLGSFQFDAQFFLEGSRIGIFGPSGSGKSTFVSLLAGLQTPDDGHIVLDGIPLFESSKHINVSPDKRRIGIVFQHSHLFPHMTVKGNLFYGYKRTTESQRRISPDTLIDMLNLGHLLQRNVSRLSGGERQRIALGRTILSCPRLVLMDEPLTGLDHDLKYQIIPYLKRVLSEFGIPLIFISHSVEEMRLMSDDVLIFSGGKFLSHQSVEDLARQNLAVGGKGYSNFIELSDPLAQGDLWRYDWDGTPLVLTEPGDAGQNLFELSAKDIMLFKRHPEASSARNLLSCSVADLFRVDNRVGVELVCDGKKLVCQIVPDSVDEMGIQVGTTLVAAVKASAFRRLYGTTAHQ